MPAVDLLDSANQKYDNTTSEIVGTNVQAALDSIGAVFKIGVGSPEGVVTANPGVAYLNQSGGTGTTLYIKETGTGNTGWVAK